MEIKELVKEHYQKSNYKKGVKVRINKKKKASRNWIEAGDIGIIIEVDETDYCLVKTEKKVMGWFNYNQLEIISKNNKLCLYDWDKIPQGTMCEVTIGGHSKVLYYNGKYGNTQSFSKYNNPTTSEEVYSKEYLLSYNVRPLLFYDRLKYQVTPYTKEDHLLGKRLIIRETGKATEITAQDYDGVCMKNDFPSWIGYEKLLIICTHPNGMPFGKTLQDANKTEK